LQGFINLKIYKKIKCTKKKEECEWKMIL